MTLPALVAELRREVVDAGPASGARPPRRGLARLAAERRARRRPGAVVGAAPASATTARCGPRRAMVRGVAVQGRRLRRLRAALAAVRGAAARGRAWAPPTSAPWSTTSPPSWATSTPTRCAAEVEAALGPARAAGRLAVRPQAARGAGDGDPARALLRRGTRAGVGAGRRRARHAGRARRAVLRGRVDRLERDARRRAARRRPQDRVAASRPRRGGRATASSAPTRSPSRRAPSPSTASRSAGAALLQVGKAAGAKTTLQVQPPLDR